MSEMDIFNAAPWPWPEARWPENFLERWREFLAPEAERESGRDLYEEAFQNELVMPLQRKRELEATIRLCRKIRPRVVLDIGSDKGGGLYHWVKCLPTIDELIAIEPRGFPYAELLEARFERVSFLWLAESSQNRANLERIHAFLGLAYRRVDLLWIDGDKGQTLADFKLYSPLVRPGGLVLIHDIQDEGPLAAFARLRQKHRNATIIDTSEWDDARRREAIGLPPASSYEAWLRVWKGRSCGVGILYL